MYPFKGRQPIANIQLIPEKYLPRSSKTRQLLIERGQKYFGYKGKAHLVEYVGDAWLTTASQVSKLVHILTATCSGSNYGLRMVCE